MLRIAAVSARRWAVTLLLLALLPGCGDPPAVSSAPEPARAVTVEVVEPRDVAPTLAVPGVVEAESRIELSFRVTGYVERFHVEEGDRVEADQTLAELDAADLEREVRAAQAALERVRAHAREARRGFERQKKLHERRSASQQAFDAARSAHEMARAELAETRMRLETAEDQLHKATLRAPVAGHIERRLVDAHELATAQTPVLVLTVLDEVKVRAAASEIHLARLRAGSPVLVRTAVSSQPPLRGELTRLDLAADPVTRTVPFEVVVPNEGLRLRPEMVVEIEVPLGAPRALLLVPLASVLRGADTRPFCFLAVNGAGGPRAERRPVSIGAVHGERVVVEDGLASGDRVITRGQHFLRPGDAVTVVETAARAEEAAP